MEKRLAAAVDQAAETLAAARDATAQARSVRRSAAMVLSRVAESLKRRPDQPEAGDGQDA